MPFIKKEDRQRTSAELLYSEKPGDKCFVFYRHFMEMWRERPCWTTIDTMLVSIFPDDLERAKVLAFLVFFNLHGMPYEEEKRKENGDIS